MEMRDEPPHGTCQYLQALGDVNRGWKKAKKSTLFERILLFQFTPVCSICQVHAVDTAKFASLRLMLKQHTPAKRYIIAPLR